MVLRRLALPFENSGIKSVEFQQLDPLCLWPPHRNVIFHTLLSPQPRHFHERVEPLLALLGQVWSLTPIPLRVYSS
jgi:hypothetical protein